MAFVALINRVQFETVRLSYAGQSRALSFETETKPGGAMIGAEAESNEQWTSKRSFKNWG